MENPLRWAAIIIAVCNVAAAAEISVDFGRTGGGLRPLHGVNLGPLCYRGTIDLSPYHRELAIPLTRLHDVVWLHADAVDISTLFRDFRNSPEQAESYDFATTDDYIQAILNVGSQIVYRLGESIEHTPRKYRVQPPSDPQKWARICVGIVRHYNEGWAGGFEHRIRYWEIWNEPDVRPAMWTGTDEQFFQLYEITARLLKDRFPDLKVGGPALGGTGEFVGDRFVPAAFCTNFLAFCATRNVPLDFLSWHRYTSDPWDLPRRAGAMRRLLDTHGLTNTESHLNEWNYLPRDDWHPMLVEGQGALRRNWYEEMGGPSGAAFAACGLMLLQDAPVNAANFYTGEIQAFGLFDFHGVPKKTFYAFKAFRQLLETPIRVEVRGAAPGRWSSLGGISADATQAGLLIGSFLAAPGPLKITTRHLPWKSPTRIEGFAVDASHDFERMACPEFVGETLIIDMPSPGVVLLKLRPAATGW